MFFVFQRFSTFLQIIFILKIVSIRGQFQEPTTTTIEPTISEKKCVEYGSAVYTYTYALSLGNEDERQRVRVDKCGHNVIPLIVHDRFASPREFPHVALLGYENKENQIEWLCEGTLISDQYVLTAAHCIFTRDGEPKHVRLGDLNNLKNVDDADPEDFNITQIISHPNYKPPLAYDDIGLIKLDRKVQFNPYKRPACLPTAFEEKQNLLSASVWDQPQFGEDTSGRLQKIILEKIPIEKCNETYGELSHRKLSKGIISKQICAGPKYQSKDTCQRGSSGPIQVLHPSVYCMSTVIGVTSFGIPCGVVGVPGVYTRVFSYLDWIENIVWN